MFVILDIEHKESDSHIPYVSMVQKLNPYLYRNSYFISSIWETCTDSVSEMAIQFCSGGETI